MYHEGKIMRDAAKLSKGGISGLAKILGVSRVTVYRLAESEILDTDVKQKVASYIEQSIHELFPGPQTQTESFVTGTQERNLGLPASANDTIDRGDPAEAGIYRNKSGNEFIPLPNGQYVMMVPVVHERSAAGYLRGWGDPEYIDALPMKGVVVDVPHLGAFRIFEIGPDQDSMEDGTARSIPPGGQILGQRISRAQWLDSKLSIKKFEVFTIVHRDGITTKQIIDHNVSQGLITCHSYNPDKKKHPDFVLSTSDIYEIYNFIQPVV